MDGNEADQYLYALQSVEATYAYGGSGYSWFMYQDGWNKDIPNNINAPDGHGILRQGLVPYPPFPSGNPSSPLFTFEKPVGNYFRYLQHPQTVVSQTSVNEPGNYFDPYGTATLNATDWHKVTGLVKDEFGTPIEDAVVFAWNYLYSYYDDEDIYQHKLQTIYTFATIDTISNFSIEPYNWISPDNQEVNNLVKVWASAVSGNAPGISCSVGGYCPDQIPEPYFRNFTINFNSLDQDVVISSQTFPVNTIDQIMAWNSISVENSSFLGNPNNNGLFELNSRTIKMQGEVHILSGAEVNIHAEVVTPHCSDFTIQPQSRPSYAPLLGNKAFKSHKLELQFHPLEQLSIEVFPNPCQNQISIRTNNEKLKILSIILTDILGNSIQKISGSEKELKIDISDLARGIYLLKITDEETIVAKKIILN